MCWRSGCGLQRNAVPSGNTTAKMSVNTFLARRKAGFSRRFRQVEKGLLVIPFVHSYSVGQDRAVLTDRVLTHLV